MKIKIFQANWVSEIEKAINEWISENPTFEIVDIKPYATIMWDFYNGQPPTICNQWSEYTWTVIYKIQQ